MPFSHFTKDVPLFEQLNNMSHEELLEYAYTLSQQPAEGDPCSISKLEYPDNLLADIFGAIELVNAFVKPSDFDFSLSYILSTLTPREQEAIRLRYQENKTYEAMTSDFNVTRERIRQIIAKAIRRLRHPTRYNYIAYGVKGVIDRTVARRVEDITREFSKAYERNYTRGYNDGLAKAEFDAAHEKQYDKESLEKIKIEDLDLSVRSYNCLARANIRTLADIATKSADDLIRVRNMGRKSVDEIIDRCKQYNITIEPFTT